MCKISIITEVNGSRLPVTSRWSLMTTHDVEID